MTNRTELGTIYEQATALGLPNEDANSQLAKVQRLIGAAYAEGQATERDKATYNGWSNYATWVVKLWIDNEDVSMGYWWEAAQQTWEDAKADDSYPSQTKEQSFLCRFADRLKEEYEEDHPTTHGVFADLLTYALGQVNWYEIAEHYVDDVKEETNA